MKFGFNFIETFSREVIVEADSLEEAIEFLEKEAENGNEELDLVSVDGTYNGYSADPWWGNGRIPDDAPVDQFLFLSVKGKQE
jgi:hypothetical protein